MSKSVKCPKCGADIEPDSKFCDTCGTQLEPTAPRETEPQHLPPTKPEPVPPSKSEPVPPSKPEPVQAVKPRSPARAKTAARPPKPPRKHGERTLSKVPSGPVGGRGRSRSVLAWILALFFALIGFTVAFYGTSFDLTFSLFLGTIIFLIVAAIRQYKALGPISLTMAVLLIAATAGPLITPPNQSSNGPGPSPQPSYEGLIPPGKWDKTYGSERAKKEILDDRVIGQILSEYEDRIREGEGVENATAKISMQTLLLDTTETAQQVMDRAAQEIMSGENYIATVYINGIQFIIYEGNSLGFIGSFANSFYHVTYDVSSDTVSQVRSGLSSISSRLPEIDLYWDLDLPDLSWALDPIEDVLGTAVDHVVRLTKQMISQALDVTLIIGEITGMTDALNEFYSFLQERGKEFISTKVDLLAAGAGTAVEAAGALSDVIMVTMDYAEIVDTENVQMLYDLTKLLSQDIIEKAITSAEVIKAIAGGEIGLIIDENGVTLKLLGSHSFGHDLAELVLDLGLKRFEIVLIGEKIGESWVKLETTIGFSLEITSKIEITGAEISGNVKFEGDKVRSDVQNLIGMATGEWLTRWDWANLTISYGLGLGIPKGILLVPGMDLQVEVSRSISDNRVVKIVFDPSPEIQIQAQAGAEIEVSGHAGIGGEASVAGAINLGLDFSKIGADLAKILDPTTSQEAARSISTSVQDMVKDIVDISQMTDPEKLDAYEMDPSLQLEYLNAVSHYAIPTATGTQSTLEMDYDVGQTLAGYVYNILGDALGSVASNSNVGLCLKGKGGVGVGAGTTGGELAADFEIGLEGGLNIPTPVLLELGATAKEAKEEMVEGLCEKGFRLISDPAGAGSFIDQPSLLLDSDTLQGILLSLADFRLETSLTDFLTGELSDEYQELKNDAEFLKNLANSDLYFQLSVGAKGSAELGIGTEVEAALQVVLHNNGETIMNNLGTDTDELQKTTLTIGIQIGPPSLEIEAIPGTNLFVEAAIGADFLQVELAQKTNKLENVLDLFSEIFPLTPRKPEASISIDQDTWTQSYTVGETAEKKITIQNQGDVDVNLVAKLPDKITTDIGEEGLEIGAKSTAEITLTADTSLERTIQGDVYLLTGKEGAHQSLAVNLIIATGTASISTTEDSWQDAVLRDTTISKTFQITNTGGADYTGTVILPDWATPDKQSITIPARLSTTLEISLDTSQDRTLTGHLTLRSSEGDTPLVSITVQVGSPQITVDPESITKQVSPDETTTVPIDLGNEGIFDLTIDLPSNLPAWIKPDQTSITIPSDQSTQLRLELTAISPLLTHDLTLTTNDPDNPIISIPIRIATSLIPETLERVHIGSRHVVWGSDKRLSPHAHGNYLTFVGPYDRETAEGGGTYGSRWNDESMYLYDTSRQELKRISPGSTHRNWDDYHCTIVAGPAIHGDKVIYGVKEGYYTYSTHHWNYDYGFYIYDIPTGQTQKLDIPLTDMGQQDLSYILGYIGIDIYENLIVGHGNEEIWLYDLDHPEQGLKIIAREKDPTGPLTHRGTTLMFSNPVIHGDKVVYVNMDTSYMTSGGYTNHTVWMVDLSTGKETYLGWGEVWLAPRISQDYVVFGTQFGGRDNSQFKIVIHNIQTGQTSKIGQGPDPYPQMDIHHDGLVYMIVSQKTGMTLYTIEYYDITTGQNLLIASHVQGGYTDGPRLPAIYGGRIYWFDIVDGWTYLKTVTIP